MFFISTQNYREINRICSFGCAIILLLSLLSFQMNEMQTHNAINQSNWIGSFGNTIAIYSFYVFGIASYLIPLNIFIRNFMPLPKSNILLKSIINILLLSSTSALLTICFGEYNFFKSILVGGHLGLSIVWCLVNYFGVVGSSILIVCLQTSLIIVFFDKSVLTFIQNILNHFVISIQKSLSFLSNIVHNLRSRLKHTRPKQVTIEKKKKIRKLPNAKAKKMSDYSIPEKTSLLEDTKPQDLIQHHSSQLNNQSREIERHLSDFGIRCSVVAVRPGPIVTRFELALEAGTKASRITAISRDLARSLSVSSVRVVEVIPGKSVVGIELPNPKREIVRLKEILDSQPYQQAKSILSVGLGKDIAGHSVIVDLAKMPHLLVAGTTGSGKSVGLNTMILSLICKAKPDELRMIMIDPKMLELAVYDDIPHLLTPVVTNMNEAGNALRWCVMEMERRYQLMAKFGVRNIANYNAKINAQKQQMNLLDENAEKPLPYIVVIADEFADLMMVVGKKVEQLIARIAQKARAAGIHLILATQRPSVDVITGLIKANIPTRISFQVSSKIDSRTIIDQGGAEQLLGNGDMLYLPPGTSIPIRVHGAFVDDDEVHRVVSHLKKSESVNYVDGITSVEEGENQGESNQGGGEKDPLYDQAVQIVLDSKKTSISYLQRRLRVGYNRAALLIESMEFAGILSKADGNSAREILVKHDS